MDVEYHSLQPDDILRNLRGSLGGHETVPFTFGAIY